MSVPFSAGQFFDVFARYHAGTWPMPLVLLVVPWVVVWLAATTRRSRLVTGTLAALWLWMALAYQLAFFAALTPAGYLFAALFLVEAALLAWHGLHTRRLHLAVPRDRASTIVGSVLFAYALVGYPLLAYLAGQRYPAMPTFGVPCPTVIFTFALLTWCLRPVPRSVLVVPALWSLLGLSAATSLGVVEDFALPVAAVLALAVVLRPHTHPTHHEPLERRPLELGF